jgi:hypothetical protein
LALCAWLCTSFAAASAIADERDAVETDNDVRVGLLVLRTAQSGEEGRGSDCGSKVVLGAGEQEVGRLKLHAREGDAISKESEAADGAVINWIVRNIREVGLFRVLTCAVTVLN